MKTEGLSDASQQLNENLIELEGVTYRYEIKPYLDDYLTASWWRLGTDTVYDLSAGYEDVLALEIAIELEIRQLLQQS